MSKGQLIPVDKCLKFLGNTDGRDKMAKGLQNYCKFVAWYVGGADAKRYKRVASSLSEFRSVIKFGKALKGYKGAAEIVSEGNVGLWPMIGMVSNIGDMFYKLGDNVEYLSNYGFLPFEPAYCERISKTFQFWAYFADVLIGLDDLSSLRSKCKTEEEYTKKFNKEFLGFCGDLADFLRVAPSFLEMHNIGGVKAHKGFAALMGVIVGVLGSYKIWKKC